MAIQDLQVALDWLIARTIGGIPVPITNTTPSTGPFTTIQASGNGCVFSTTGLTNNYSSYTLAAGQVQTFGSERAATITLASGQATGYREAS